MQYFGPVRHPAWFPRFLELPGELQLQIWREACSDIEPRVIKYSTNYMSWSQWHVLPHINIHKLTYTNPGILGACYDSRIEALKHYKPAFNIELGRSIYVDFTRDTFEFGSFACLQAFSIKNTPFAGSKMEGDRIKTVGITLDGTLKEYHFILLCSNFGGLETLFVREEGWWKPETEPLSEFSGAEIEKAWPWITGRIRSNIERRGGDWTSWKPPMVVRGTKEQWERAMWEKGKELVDEMEWEPVKQEKDKGTER
jgi:hypothetical protein